MNVDIHRTVAQVDLFVPLRPAATVRPPAFADLVFLLL